PDPRCLLCRRLPCMLCYCISWRPPRATHFPYTTLFRSDRRELPDPKRLAPIALPGRSGRMGERRHTFPETRHAFSPVRPDRPGKIGRAPSELQSLAYLVCRLLLEKKTKISPSPSSAATI